jgi:FixJ family two-component response regulator
MLEITPDLKTIVTSGYPSPAFVDEVHKNGTFVFIEKPYQIEHLLRAIRVVVEGSSTLTP